MSPFSLLRHEDSTKATHATRGAFTDSGQELSIVRFTQNAHVPYLSPQRLCNGATAYSGLEWYKEGYAGGYGGFSDNKSSTVLASK